GGDGLASGTLSVDGKILARSGDVVLIAPNVQVGTGALVQSPSGATILAAGQKVELTGRGLEGIRMELQAPGDQALNLGTLQGDAVGIFAGQLKHSGLIQANAVTAEGGKVVLKGLDSADISGRVTASKGEQGGQVHATASKVMLRSGAVIDVSGERGGGEALIGGGWQGKDGRIANATETLVEAGATIKADATGSGNGGTIVAWSDGSTRVYGTLSARGGAASGDGGNIETSGHYLDMQGQVDTRAPNGNTGNLLLDPTNMYVAASQLSAEAAGMALGSAQTATGPVFTPTGAVQDSFVTTSSLTGLLTTTSVTVQTTNALGTGAGFIKVVDPVSWGSGNQLTLSADTDIFVDAPITSTGTGALSLRAQGNITQTAAITVPGLLAISDFNAVTLNHSGNAVGTLAGYAGAGQNFTFTNGSALDVGSVAGSFGVGAGGSNVSLTALSGDLSISDTAYGVNAGSGAASLTASTGSVTQASLAKITASALAVTANNSIGLSAGVNDVQSFSAVQTGSTGGNIAFVNNPTATQWTLGNVTQNALSPSSVSISSVSGQDIQVQGNVVSGASSSLSVSTAGSIIQGAGGLLKSDTITLQAGGTPSGPVGSAVTPLQTASNGTSTAFTIGATGGPSGIHINHAGNAVLSSINPSINAPIEFKASGNLSVTPNLNSGSSGLFLGAGGLLSVGSLTGAGITLEADRMNLQGGASSINAGTGVLWIKPTTSNWDIDLGSSTDVAANTLELSTNEVNALAGGGALRIGALSAGSMNISAAIAPIYSGSIKLESGGAITQTGAGTISAYSLAIKALGDVILDGTPNSVTNLAASLGDASNTNRVFKFRNGGALNLGAAIDGTSGIAIQVSGGGYDPLSPDAYISLISGGALTQSAGALIGAKAVYAEGSRVALTEGNFTGVIAGKATGAATGDSFKYTSINGINVNNVGPGSGIQNANGPDPVAIELTGTNVSQRAGSAITAAGGLKLVTTGPVNLSDGGNNVSALTATGASSLVYRNLGALTVGIAGTGVSATGGVDIRSADALTVQSNVSGSGVILKANGAGKDLNINAVVDTGSGGGDLVAANDVLLNNATLTGSGTTNLGAGNAAKVTSGTTTLNTSLAGTPLDVQGTLVVGSNVTVDSLNLASGGSITGAGDLMVGSSLSWSGGIMTGSGDTTIGPGATATITGGVSLVRHMVNASGGTIVLSGSGQIAAMSPGSLDNSGFFDIQNDGGFAGSAFTISNSGTFTKSAGTGVSAVSGVNFINNGSLAVSSGTLQFGSAGFSSNSGLVLVGTGATLDNSNTTLANTSAGVIKGSGTLRLGTGTLNNSGTLMPGGPGAVGTLTIEAATVNLDAGTHVYADVVSTSSFDRLNVTGNVNLASGVTVVPDISAAIGLLPGDSFDIIQSSLGSVGGALPVVPGLVVTLESSPVPALRVALASPPPLPAPVPPPPAALPLTSGTTADQIAGLIEGDHALATQVVAEFSTNPLTTFTELVLKEEEPRAGDGRGVDNLVDNNQCRR
ncbi:beta strand repeat-containing protein, partial [Caenimonas soli]|uniref:beta strand repeat-containing protein n=1 Tax=Caenimonas soli TaxID=2735555 RepID=UPI0015581F8F